MKAEQFEQLTTEESVAKEAEMREQLFRLRFQLSMGQADGIKKYRALKKDLARLLTVRAQLAAALIGARSGRTFAWPAPGDAEPTRTTDS